MSHLRANAGALRVAILADELLGLSVLSYLYILTLPKASLSQYNTFLVWHSIYLISPPANLLVDKHDHLRSKRLNLHQPCPKTASPSRAVGDWEVCGDFFYSRELLYDMGWEEVDLQQKR